MAQHNTLEVCRTDLFTAEDELRLRYPDAIADRVLRIREEYNWFLSNPDAKDRQFVENAVSRFSISKVLAYSDLAIVKVNDIHGTATRPMRCRRASRPMLPAGTRASVTWSRNGPR